MWNSFKKVLSGATAVMLIASQSISWLVYSVSTTVSAELESAVEFMMDNGMTSAKDVASYGPYETVTRAAAAKFYANFAKNVLKSNADISKSCAFGDISNVVSDIQTAIMDSCQLGLFKGDSSSNFLPYRNLYKSEAIVVLVRALHWDQGSLSANLEKASSTGIANDIINIYRSVTRAEIALMLSRASNSSAWTTTSDDDSEDIGDILGWLFWDDDDDSSTSDDTSTNDDSGNTTTSDDDTTIPDDDTTTDDTTTDDTTTDDTTTSVPVEWDEVVITLNPKTPTYQRFPKGADGIVSAIFDFSAWEKDVTVKSALIKRIGDGASDAVDTIALYDAMGRVSKVKSFNSSDDTAQVYFDPVLVVKAGTTESVKAVVSLETNAGNQFAIQIVSVDTSSTVNAQLPLAANLMEIWTTTATALQLQSTGSISNPKVWEKGVEIWKMKLKNNTSNNEDLVIKSITLKETWSADEEDDIRNIKLMVDGKEVASVERLTSKYLSFDLGDGVTLKESKTEEFKITADITWWPNKTLAFEIERALDIVAEGSKYTWIDVSVSNNTALQTLTLQAGELTLTSIEPTNLEVRKDKDDIILWKIKVTSNAGQWLELQKFTVVITKDSGSASMTWILENVELYDETNGSVYDLSCDDVAASRTCSDTSLNITLPEVWDMTFAIRADTQNSTDVWSVTFHASVSSIGTASTTTFYVVETEDDVQVIDITPSSVTFKTIEWKSSSATLNILPLSTAKNAVIGSQDIVALEFEIEADDSSALEVDEIKTTALTLSGTFDSATVSQVKLFKDSISDANLLDTVPWSQIASNVATFDWFKSSIAKSTKQKYIVTMSIVDDATLAEDTLNIWINATWDVSIEDEDSDDVYITTTGASARTVTVKGAGTLAVAVDTTDTEVDKTKNILWNTTSPFVASYEFTATNEPVKIKDLQIIWTWDSANFVNAVSEVIIYGNDKTTEIDRESVTSTWVTFSNINHIVDEWSENLYVKVITRKIGKDQAGVQTSDLYLSLLVTDAEGNSSNKSVTAPSQTSDSLAFKVLPVRISSVAFVDSYSSQSRDTKFNWGDQNLAIVALTTDSSTNTDTDWGSLKILLTQLKLKISAYNAANYTGFTVEKISGSDWAIAWTIATDYVTFNTTALTGDDEIDNGTTAYYLIKATLAKTGSAENDDYIKVEFDALDGGEVTYASDHITYSGTTVTDLRIWVTKIDGTQINE